MKISYFLAVAIALLILALPGFCQSGSPPDATNGDYQIVSRSLHSRVFERVVARTNSFGTILRTNSFTEIGPLYHQGQNGEWVENRDDIQLTDTGAAGLEGACKAWFPADIADPAARVVIETPEGHVLSSRVFGISFLDKTTGESVLVGETRSSVGVLHPPNQIVYPNCFSNITASLRYTYTRAGVEQDVIIESQFPSTPQECGLSNAVVEVLTEFFSPPMPVRNPRLNDGMLTDDILDFGEMKVIRGKAFLVGAGAAQSSYSVSKQWTQFSGRDFLIEFLNWSSIEPNLQTLPAAPTAAKPSKSSLRHIVSNKPLLPNVAQASPPNATNFLM
jgi:hypothetical protein